MHRRQYLRGAILCSFAPFAGCSFGGLPSNITAVEFSVQDADISDSSNNISEIDCTDSMVSFQGTIKVGSSECSEAKLERLSLENGSLRILISYDQNDNFLDSVFSSGCSDDISIDQYSITVHFEESPPEILVITHDPYSTARNQTTKSIECAN